MARLGVEDGRAVTNGYGASRHHARRQVVGDDHGAGLGFAGIRDLDDVVKGVTGQQDRAIGQRLPVLDGGLDQVEGRLVIGAGGCRDGPAKQD